jgi:putative acetyltransferase
LEDARAAGYRKMYGDTLKTMKSALKLYRHIGFAEVGQYSANPTPDAVYLRLLL